MCTQGHASRRFLSQAQLESAANPTEQERGRAVILTNDLAIEASS